MANKLKSNTPATAEKPVVKEKAEKAEKASKPKPVAKKKPAPQKFQNDKEEKVDLKKLAKDERTWKIIGTVSLLISIFLFIAFVSYLFTWDDDQSQVLNRGVAFLWDNDKESEVSNLLGRLGAYASHNLIYNGFGLASFLFCTFFFVVGINLLFERKVFSIWRNLKYVTIGLLIVSISLSFLFSFAHFPYGGKVGDMISQWMIGLVGTIGTAALLIVVVASYLIWQFNPSFNLPEKKSIPIAEKNEEAEGAKLIVDTSLLDGKTVNDLYADEENTAVSEKGNLLKGEGEMVLTINNEDANSDFTLTEKDEPEDEYEDDVAEELMAEEPVVEKEITDDLLHKHDLPVEPVVKEPQKKKEESTPASNLELEIKTAEEEPQEENKEKDYSDLPPYEPTLDLRDYKYPKIDLLETYGNEKIVQDPAELEANKNQIINTLKNYDITIQKISATIGPTVTLYEIVPAAGVRISRIKNLEDDIALSLAALGIRIIAPIPGRGTIGIEVPNIKKTIVSMKGLLSSEKFTHSNYNLPIAIGKKIDNENFIVDLTTMPHLLMAGATGQGKSVGLNAILVSLLYKKHPSQLKFVLVDPKKVELSIYRHIEKHFLAKLPGEEDAIITDTKKVINTLNALCIEMDNRYDLLKEAGARNIKEYNEKFTKRRLNPQKGHQYLPFIVLVVDEFADLIMTAGKEVEMPIARLAQLARAVGIHLVIATQRPSVNIITGTIKANFPARIAFKVSSKIDSRTILDAGGAEQLIGKGDMLISYNGDITRLQCAFVDTPEVERVVEFISD
ncbi:MAG TPA: DNA translocase FtsK, partial [Flavisolibacter sp.]|nr:DNA translocase FtsK [Flavisolibacter sp.]